MGYMLHYTIVVSCWEEETIGDLHKKALEIFEGKLVSNIVDGVMNSQYSFFIAPDGSKEGWNTSKEYDKKREIFKDVLKNQDYAGWVEVYFDGDSNECSVSDSNNHNKDIENNYEL
jgi:hypothetical protein